MKLQLKQLGLALAAGALLLAGAAQAADPKVLNIYN
jgi:spermidine/putrescine-binding protein